MASIRRGLKYLISNRALFFDSIIRNYLGFLPDKLYLSLRYRCILGYWMDWNNPRTFSEKIQWLKIYDRKSEYISMVDKLLVKEYVANLIGKEYIIPTLGVWKDPRSINWELLPNQFVLKTNHSGGSCGIIICKDKSTLDIEAAIKKLRYSLDYDDIYSMFREWPYANITRCVMAEHLLSQSYPNAEKDLPDYKFFCFNGEPLYCQVIRDRHENETIDFYDMDWNHQDFVGLQTILSSKGILTNGSEDVPRPVCLEEMKDICRKLSFNIPFVRIDLYVIDDKVYFGEMTFYPASGFGSFTPEPWQIKLGELINLKPLQ